MENQGENVHQLQIPPLDLDLFMDSVRPYLVELGNSDQTLLGPPLEIDDEESDLEYERDISSQNERQMALQLLARRMGVSLQVQVRDREYISAEIEIRRGQMEHRMIQRLLRIYHQFQESGGTNLLPLSSRDLPSTHLEPQDLSLKAFLGFVGGSVLGNIIPQQHRFLLAICLSFLGYRATNTTNPFDIQVGKPINIPRSLLSFGEAFLKYAPQISHATMLGICYIVAWMLVFLPLRPEVQIILVLLLICPPFFYFLDMIHKASASGVYVDIGGSFKLPLIGFTTLSAAGLSLIFGLMTFLVCYSIWRFIYKGDPRVREG